MGKPPLLQGLLKGAFSSLDVDALGGFHAASEGVEVAGFGNPTFASRGYTAIQATKGTAAALLQAWRTLGKALLQEVRGDFALACGDVNAKRGLVAVDRFATHSLFWAAGSEGLAFSTRPLNVPSYLGRAPELDARALHAYIYFHAIPAPFSICRGVQRLDCGEAIFLESGRLSDVVRYWHPQFSEEQGFDFPLQRTAFLQALEKGVAEGINGLAREDVGCFLSGGTDSSTIAGLATRAFGGPARTFSIVYAEAAYDESRYSRLASSHFRTEHLEHVLTPDEAIRAIDVLSRSYEQPFGNSSAVPTYVCACVARESGVRKMLGGDGGDELYGGNARYSFAWQLSLYQRLPRVLREQVLERLLLGGTAPHRSWLLSKGASYVRQARRPLPERIQGESNLLNHFGRTTVFTEALIAAQASFEPVDLEREIWNRCQDPTLINRLLAYDFKFTLGDNDLPKVTRMCHAAGIEVAFPMLTDALVQHSLQLPAQQKLRGTNLRYFFRRALRGFLPDEIIDKTKHGFGMPFGEWLTRQPPLAARADEALASLAARGLVRPEFIAHLRRQVAQGHASYFGTMVWVLMILELWLRDSPFADLDWSER